ncbi:hypothetical protein [Nocardia sp. NPDC060249]|uniref:hypothetical protein n=1 Tax=Nocardia sp. NPDC060249 TaxID=3347082 RepID=UPI0036550BE5
MVDDTARVVLFSEWVDYAEKRANPRAEAYGVLAQEIRTRFGANKHAAVWLSEESDGCECCGYTHEWVIECGEHRSTIDIDDGYELSDYVDWLAEPQRRAKARAEAEARAAEAKAQADAAINAYTSGIIAALNAVEAEGYTSDQDWHDKLMVRLGVKNVGEAA